MAKKSKRKKKKDTVITRADFRRLKRDAVRQLKKQQEYFELYGNAYQQARDAFKNDTGG